MEQKNYSNSDIPADVKEFAMNWMKSAVENMLDDRCFIEAILFDNFSHFISFLHDQWRVLDDEPTYLEGLLAQFPGAEDIDWTGFIKQQMNNMNPVIAVTSSAIDSNDEAITELYEVVTTLNGLDIVYIVQPITASYHVVTDVTGSNTGTQYADFKFINEDESLNWYRVTEEKDIDTGFCFNDLQLVGNSVYSADWFEEEGGISKSLEIYLPEAPDNFSPYSENADYLVRIVKKLYTKYNLHVIGSELIDEQ